MSLVIAEAVRGGPGRPFSRVGRLGGEDHRRVWAPKERDRHPTARPCRDLERCRSPGSVPPRFWSLRSVLAPHCEPFWSR